MESQRKLYSDADGVERGYYVYLHRDNDSDEVFYVGKGHGQRAWENKRRSKLWKEKVASLSISWSVEIVKDDLSELEAFDFEEELVERYGGAAKDGGTLTNLVPGGENPMAVGFAFTITDEWLKQAEREGMWFSEYERAKQEAIARFIRDMLESIVEELSEIANDEGDDSERAEEVEVIVGSVVDEAAEFLRRRIRPVDLGMAIAECREDLQSELEEASSKSSRVHQLHVQALEFVERLMSKEAGLPNSSSTPHACTNNDFDVAQIDPQQTMSTVNSEGNVSERADSDKRRDFALPRSNTDKIMLGKSFEADGEIDKAIVCYEDCIRKRFEGNGPYDRLAVIYRKLGRRDDEIRVLNEAISVFEAIVLKGFRADGPPKLTKFQKRLAKLTEKCG